MKRLCVEAEALCRAVAPDLAGGPLYIVLPSDLPAELRPRVASDGCTMRHLDLILRPMLERAGRWRGRGPAMLIDAPTIASGERHRPRFVRRRVFGVSAFGIVLHELAHVLDAGPGDADPPAELVAFGRAILTADESVAPTNGPGAAVPWRWHEWRFIRTALHLAHRAAACGVALWPSGVFDASDYGLSPTRAYMRALGDEPDRFAGRDFATIFATPVPPAFAGLWRADMRRWLSQSEPTDELSQALATGERRILIPSMERTPC
ncbi:MAG: hypothetical protein LC135_05315 [Phycisphaerae bacterium]|nr:hypothetical protein [Phycisphaerae bacterium]MCZ2399273.1 hypothetical protein [Phycisphaerae bacterium]